METLGSDEFWKAKAQRTLGATWFKNLSSPERWELGDALVLGYFDWRDWFEEPPGRDFMKGVEEARIYWEQTVNLDPMPCNL